MASDSIPPTEPSPNAEKPHGSLPGYTVSELIGRGGMGEVLLAHDDEIGRDVAVKRIHRQQGDDALLRFLREARIQARLEHPGIVPVYEIGHDGNGEPYFAMKRMVGTTLAELLRSEPLPPRQRLVRVFADICRTIEFAHARGIIHRDLKPANIGVGEFGEIYVLDWGLARVAGEDEPPAAIGPDVVSPVGMTKADVILGTPGYMSPEQLQDPRAVKPASDVYALGAILFEILAREPLHPRGTAALASTAVGIDGSPGRRHRELDMPPELDAACVAALAFDASNRPSARELADRVERYLDGDRDLERRRALAAEHLAAARESLPDASQRAASARAAGRALALDPESPDAARLINQLLFEIPAELPPALQQMLAASEANASRRQARLAFGSYIAVGACVAAAGWSGVLNWTWWAAIVALVLVHSVLAFRLTRRAPRRHEMMFIVLGNAVLVALISRAFGSLIVAPGVTCIMVLSFVSYPQLMKRAPLVIAILVGSWVVPTALEFLGVLSRSWTIDAEGIHSTSSTLVIGGTNTIALLVGIHVGLIMVTGLYASNLAASRYKALRNTKIREWHLRQLLSDRVASSSDD
jgi:serine/threonine-protein kinase